jgi:hypothetical protein
MGHVVLGDMSATRAAKKPYTHTHTHNCSFFFFDFLSLFPLE